MKLIKSVAFFTIFALTVSSAWAADEAAIQDLQTDVTAANGKANKNAQEINALKGGLPAVETRVAALEAALTDAMSVITNLQADLATANALIAQLQMDVANSVTAAQLAAILQDFVTSSQLTTSLVDYALQADLDAAINGYMMADAGLQSQIDTLDPTSLGNRITDVENKLTCASYDQIMGNFILEGCDVHIRNGQGSTNTANGTGNLILGYNDNTLAALRIGSHNVILGDDQEYNNSGRLLTQYVESVQDLTIVTGRNISIISGNDLLETIGGNRFTAVAFDQNLSVGRDRTETTGLALNISADTNLTLQGDLDMSLQGGNQLSLKSGIAQTVMLKNGDIDTDGKNIDINATGSIDIKAAGAITIKGSNIDIN